MVLKVCKFVTNYVFFVKRVLERKGEGESSRRFQKVARKATDGGRPKGLSRLDHQSRSDLVSIITKKLSNYFIYRVIR